MADNRSVGASVRAATEAACFGGLTRVARRGATARVVVGNGVGRRCCARVGGG